MLGWPFPCFMDNAWPVALLDFYPDTDSPWPIAPLSAGLGHLITLNVLLAAYVEQAYENRKSIIAVIESYAKDVMDKLNSRQNPAIVEIKADLEQQVDHVIQYLNRPNMNTDILQAIELELRLFARATGLVDFMYGAEAKVSRSARDIAAKEEKTAIRPEKMSKDIAAWQTKAATLEAFLAVLEVRGVDVMPYIPAPLWEMLVVQQDPELVMREMDCIVEATDVRRPNRERDMSNLQILSQTETAMLQQYAADTGDTNPLNAFRRSIWRSMEQPFTQEMALGPWQPQPPPPEVQQQMQMEMQAEQMKAEAEQQKLAAEIQLKQMELQFKSQESEMKMAAEAQKAQIDAAKGVSDLQFDALKQRQGLLFDSLSHEQELRQDEQRHDVDLRQAEEQGAAKVKLMRAQARAKPKANGTVKAKA